jgi:hypothetical protein
VSNVNGMGRERRLGVGSALFPDGLNLLRRARVRPQRPCWIEDSTMGERSDERG